ncbi:MAG: bifunctional (p)ppGpp synthetase/guanosine-3',5'-bis(diphosphate) 3'-pyrophosphohydrolase [Burkholderiaceae bacterium]|nr:bifunctional (p)ppGpp synthetase/guanosine-3',5'-bis(diphosphate) 3'-pyrophosphohydrolase [Burkholderiaceae bacterium]
MRNGGEPTPFLARQSERALEILEPLGVDQATRSAVLLAMEFDGAPRTIETFRKQHGKEVTDLLVALHRMSGLGSRVRSEPAADTPAQVETLRRMLLALADDVRVVVTALALHIADLESVAERIKLVERAEEQPSPPDNAPAPEDPFELGRRLGEETLLVQAPLANRLGIWQLKWLMEDLAFRMTEPQAYREIARQLDETRQEREAFVTTTIARLRDFLDRAGIHGEVAGRPKHLYSIHRKLKAKGLRFDQLMDIRAFRILVDTEAQCYTVLGFLHDHWKPLDSEFDDYITRPKANGYQSLHTVLLDSHGKPFEVQIRTHDMHQRAELGVAAHWKYKESGGSHASSGDYAARISWLRQMLDWGHGPSGQVRLGDDRVYALTPMARIIELPKGATPLDFAYHLHTEIGHRCRGAKVDGHIVPLTAELQTGQTVELMTVKTGGPSRDWMNPDSGYLRSPRARQKVRTWFHALDLAEGRTDDKAGDKATESSPDAERLKRSEISAEELILSKITKPKEASKGQVLVVGVDRMLTALARCCKPAPPDVIKGFVTRGRGVSVHRASCVTFARMAQDAPERVIETEWGNPKQAADARYLVDAVVVAKSRAELVRDIAEVLAREKVPLARMDSFPKGEQVTMNLSLQVADGGQLGRALSMIRDISGVVSAQRS